jgi:hypothetical protein
MRRDLLTRRDSIARRAGLNRRDAATDMHVESTTDDQDEPTWEVRQPSARRRRLDGRTRSILSAAAVTAVVVNAGAAWAYWRVTASETGSARAGSTVELALRGRSDLNRPLARGATGNLIVTLTNDNDFPIRITSVSPGPGNVVADGEHRDAGCLATGVSMTRASFVVSWYVAKNTIGAFTVPEGLTMAAAAGTACQGATFTVPLQVAGVSEAP